jgi:hypothetical protein
MGKIHKIKRQFKKAMPFKSGNYYNLGGVGMTFYKNVNNKGFFSIYSGGHEKLIDKLESKYLGSSS